MPALRLHSLVTSLGVFLFGINALCAAESTTLETAVGVIERVDAQDPAQDPKQPAGLGARVLMRFDPQQAKRVLPGGIVGLYAAGAVEKHPLTGQVVVARPVLKAKAQITQVIGLEPGQAMAQVKWLAEGVHDTPSLATGMDAIWLPKEPTPNAAPGLVSAAITVTAMQGSLASLIAPIADVDADPLMTRWSLRGPAGASGRLIASTSGGTAMQWLAPAVATDHTDAVSAVAEVSDPLGQSCEVVIPLQVSAATSISGRTPKLFSRWGQDQEPALVALERHPSGVWWGVADNGAPMHWSAGWQSAEALTGVPAEQLPRRAVALALNGDEIHVLDADRRQVLVYGIDGSVRRTYGESEAPTDLALAADGTAFIADQKAGGIHIIEADGSYRGRLGRTGQGTGQFQGLVAVCCDGSGRLYALDQVQHAVTGYDRFQRRFDTWTIPGSAADEPVDLAVHPQRGVVVLYQSGRLVALGTDETKGPSEVAQPVAEAGIDPGQARRIAIDGLGQVVTTHPQQAMLVRYDDQLHCTGMRGYRAITARWWAADGAGRSYGLDATSGMVTIVDAEGWSVLRLNADAPGGGLFSKALAIAVTPKATAIWVVDARKHGLHRLDLTTTTTPAFTGGEGTDRGQFDEPVAAACDDTGRVYVLDAGARRVQILEPSGSFAFSFGSEGKAPGEFKDPERIAVDPSGTLVYVYDAYGHEVKKFAVDHSARSARHLATAGSKGTGPGQYHTVEAFGCDRLGLLHVFDSDRGDWQVVDFRAASPVVISATPVADLGLAKATDLAISPDGHGLLAAPGRLSWFRF